MLQKLNERIQGMVAWIIVILVAVTFTLFGLDYYLQARHESAALAEVNGQAIESVEFRQQYRRQTLQHPQLSVQASAEIKQQVLNNMIVKKVAGQAAHELGFAVSPVQANATVMNIPQFQYKGKFSTANYAQALQTSFFTPSSFQAEVQNSMLLNQQQFAFVNTEFVLPETFDADVKVFFQTRDYDFLLVPAKLFLATVHVSPEQINNYYQKNTKNYLEPEQVSIEYLHLSMQDIKNNIKITPEEIKHYYADNQNHAPFESESNKIKQQLINDQAQAAYANALEQLSELSYENPESLSAAASVLHLPIQHSEFFAKQGGTHGITQNQHVARAAFRHDVLDDGNNSATIPIGDNEVIVLRIKQRRAAQVQALSAVSEGIEQKLALRDARKLAHKWVQNFLKTNPNQTLINLPTKIPGLTWQRIEHAAGTKNSPENKVAFSLPKIGAAVVVKVTDGDYAIVQLSKIQPGVMTDPAKRVALQAQWAAEQGGMVYDAFIQDKMRHAKIQNHRSAK